MSHDIIGLHEQAWHNPLKSNAFQIGTFGMQRTERPYRSTSCRCPATAPTSCRSRRSGAGSARMSPITTATPPPRISAGGWPLSRTASIRTPAPSPTASGSKITSTLTKKNYASQIRRGLGEAGFAGLTSTLVSQNNQYVRYQAAYNQTEFNAILQNQLYVKNIVGKNKITFPSGSLDIKSSWIDMNGVPNPQRFYKRTVW